VEAAAALFPRLTREAARLSKSANDLGDMPKSAEIEITVNFQRRARGITPSILEFIPGLLHHEVQPGVNELYRASKASQWPPYQAERFHKSLCAHADAIAACSKLTAGAITRNRLPAAHGELTGC